MRVRGGAAGEAAVGGAARAAVGHALQPLEHFMSFQVWKAGGGARAARAAVRHALAPLKHIISRLGVGRSP